MSSGVSQKNRQICCFNYIVLVAFIGQNQHNLQLSRNYYVHKFIVTCKSQTVNSNYATFYS